MGVTTGLSFGPTLALTMAKEAQGRSVLAAIEGDFGEDDQTGRFATRYCVVPHKGGQSGQALLGLVELPRGRCQHGPGELVHEPNHWHTWELAGSRLQLKSCSALAVEGKYGGHVIAGS